MISKAQAKRDRKALLRAIAKDLKAKARQKVKDLRAAVRTAKKARVTLQNDAKARCRSERLAVRQRIEERRKRALAELRAANRQAREGAKFICTAQKATARRTYTNLRQQARAALEAEQAYQAELKRIERNNRLQRPALAKARVRKAESDDEVRGNIPADMVPLFDRVRRGIKGSDRQSRTEAFLHYAEEHPREVLGALDAIAEERIKELESAHKAARRASRKKRYTAAELADVPF